MDSLLINGKREALPKDRCLLTLLRDYGYDPMQQRFIVAVNETLVPAEQWSQTEIQPGDCIEIMGAITGG